jgi:hypothetical protein
MSHGPEMVVPVMCECIVRREDVYSIASKAPWLMFVGHTAALAEAVERCNSGKATEADLAALSTFPVFDFDTPDTTQIIMVVA